MSRRKKEERKLAVEVEFVPTTSTSTAPAPAHPPPHQQSSHLQEKKQRVKSVRQKESQALPKVDLADDLASTENEVFLTPEEEIGPAITKAGAGASLQSRAETKVPTPVSATFSQSRPLTDLDSALREFRSSTAASRENLSNSRSDLSIAAVRASIASRPPLALPRGAPPPAASTAWRQKAPPSNPYMENQWAKLSASMVDLSRSRSSLCPPTGETSLSTEAKPEHKGEEEERFKGDRRQTLPALSTRAISMDTLDHSASQVPENRLCQLLPYQERVRASMERLSVPAWYRGAPSSGSASLKSSPSATTSSPSPASSGRLPANATPPKWRLSSTSSASTASTPAGWRRHLANTTPSAPSSLASAASSPSPIPPPQQAAKQPYLGWRSQERLDIGPSYLNSPARRLAATTAFQPQRSATLPPLLFNLKGR